MAYHPEHAQRRPRTTRDKHAIQCNGDSSAAQKSPQQSPGCSTKGREGRRDQANAKRTTSCQEHIKQMRAGTKETERKNNQPQACKQVTAANHWPTSATCHLRVDVYISRYVYVQRDMFTYTGPKRPKNQFGYILIMFVTWGSIYEQGSHPRSTVCDLGAEPPETGYPARRRRPTTKGRELGTRRPHGAGIAEACGQTSSPPTSPRRCNYREGVHGRLRLRPTVLKGNPSLVDSAPLRGCKIASENWHEIGAWKFNF